MVMIIPPGYKVSEVVGRIKAQTASHLIKKYHKEKKVLAMKN